MIQLIRNNKNLVTLAKSTLLTNEDRARSLLHSKDNIIDLDSDSDPNNGEIHIQTVFPSM